MPSERSKNGKSNVVPLPDFAMRLVAEADKHRVKAPPTRLNRKDRKPYDPNPAVTSCRSCRRSKKNATTLRSG